MGRRNTSAGSRRLKTEIGSCWGRGFGAFLATMYVDNLLLIGIQHSSDNTTAMTVSGPLASDYMWLGEPGATLSLEPKNSIDWDTTITMIWCSSSTRTL